MLSRRMRSGSLIVLPLVVAIGAGLAAPAPCANAFAPETNSNSRLPPATKGVHQSYRSGHMRQVQASPAE